jgi:hypothetical protein
MHTSVPVEVVCTTGTLPFVAVGRVTSFDHGVYTIDLDQDASHLVSGVHTILSFPDGSTARVIGRIESAQGNRVRVVQEQLRSRERRSFPRLHGGLPVRYQSLGPGEHELVAARWMRGDEAMAQTGEWVRPEEFMNFSVTGLKFRTERGLLVDDLLLLELSLRGRTEKWRCTARVVQVEIESDGVFRAAVEFERIPEDAQAALSELTLDIQAALLE